MNQNNISECAVEESFLTAMSSDDFWEIVQECKTFADPTAGAKDKLAELQPQQVAAFKWHLENYVGAAYSYDIWGAAYMLSYWCSDDGFEYFRYGLVSQGRATYEEALRNPDSLVELWGHPDISNEEFCYAAAEVYEEMTGRELPPECWSGPGPRWSAYVSGLSTSTMRHDWDFNNVIEGKKRLPKLSALYFKE